MADVFTAATTCLGVMAELAPAQRRRLLSVLTAAIDLGDEHGPAPLAGDVTMNGREMGTGVIVLPREPVVREADAPRVAPLETPRRKTAGPKDARPGESRPQRAPNGLRPSEQRAAQSVLIALRTATPEGMTFSELREHSKSPQATLSYATRHLLSKGQIRTTGTRGTPSARWHLSPESPQ
jgi:hypothetical protein